ncbi:hypothetical protein H1235_11195 [Pseudoxanthomonas sp. NC8]|nr:hypothetical protein H1235_11195 [Pseudoxanthomonas sp. NC8]
MDGAAPRRPGLWGTGTPVWIAALLALALVGFWKPYVSRVAAMDAVTHLHAGLMLSWLAMLFVQPLLIRTRRLKIASAGRSPLLRPYAGDRGDLRAAVAGAHGRGGAAGFRHAVRDPLPRPGRGGDVPAVLDAGDRPPPRRGTACALHGRHRAGDDRSGAGANRRRTGAAAGHGRAVDQLRRGVRDPRPAGLARPRPPWTQRVRGAAGAVRDQLRTDPPGPGHRCLGRDSRAPGGGLPPG